MAGVSLSVGKVFFFFLFPPSRVLWRELFGLSSCFLVERAQCLLRIPSQTSQNCGGFLWKHRATAVLVWRRSNILLGSQEQTCQVK